MRKIRREILRKVKELAIESWNKEKLDKSKKFLIPYVDEIIKIAIDNLIEESNEPPKVCCGHYLEATNITLYEEKVKTRKGIIK